MKAQEAYDPIFPERSWWYKLLQETREKNKKELLDNLNKDEQHIWNNKWVEQRVWGTTE